MVQSLPLTPGSSQIKTNFQTMTSTERSVPFAVSFVSGGISGTVGAVITCPLEVVKTRLQSSLYNASNPSGLGSPVATAANTVTSAINSSPTQSILLRRSAGPISSIAFHVRGTLNVLNTIYVKEGMQALWKGVGATVVGVMPSRAIYFSTYAKTKHLLTDRNGGQEGALIHLSAAAAAGVATASVTNPIWLIKTRMQLQQSHNRIYTNSWDCLKKVIANEGVRGLYKGLSASYLGVAEGTIQWVLYEKMKHHLRTHYNNNGKGSNNSMAWLNYFLAAAGSKLVAATLTYPHEVLRTRLREQSAVINSPGAPAKYRGLLQAARLIVKEEGAAALYGGMTAHMMRVVPNSAIMFFCYEFLTHIYTSLDNDSVHK